MEESGNIHVSVVYTVLLADYMSVSVGEDWLTKVWILLLGLSQEIFPFLVHLCLLFLH